MVPDLNTDSFHPRIFYVSREYYDRRNSLSSHFHPFCVIMYFHEINGSGWYRVEGNLHPIEKGSLVICNPAVYHEKILDPGSSICEYHIAFDSISFNGLPPNCILDAASYQIIKAGSLQQRIENGFAEIMEEQLNSLPGCEVVVHAVATKIIALVLRLINHTSGARQAADPSCRPQCAPVNSGMLLPGSGGRRIAECVRRYLNENFQRQISIGNMAKALHISHVYLSRIFRQEFGESPISYLTGLRMNLARELLESSNFTVKSAAKYVGYEDSSYFSRHFFKYFGIWPIRCKQLEK